MLRRSARGRSAEATELQVCVLLVFADGLKRAAACVTRLSFSDMHFGLEWTSDLGRIRFCFRVRRGEELRQTLSDFCF